MRLVALSLLLCVATAVHAQSITSYAPDTTNRAFVPHTPPDKVDIPVWLGFQFAPVPGVTSELQTQERTGAQNCTPWIGVGATWPWLSSSQTWLEAGYQHWEFAGEDTVLSIVGGGSIVFPRIDPLDLDEFSVRAGVDRVFWQPNRVSLAVGGGLGIGTGWATAPTAAESNVLLSSEFVGHALVYFMLNPRVRLGLGATGSIAYMSGGSVVNGWWQHLEFTARIDHSMRLPKRIVPGL